MNYSPSGCNGESRGDFPQELRERFGDRKWLAADPPGFLDHAAAELLLLADADASHESRGNLEPQPGDEHISEVSGVLDLGFRTTGAVGSGGIPGPGRNHHNQQG
jgi:hypothetical protein